MVFFISSFLQQKTLDHFRHIILLSSPQVSNDCMLVAGL
jgi:hypothetical protein